MTCPTCNQEVAAVRVGTGSYCSICGDRLAEPVPASAVRSLSTSRALDLRPRSQGGVANTTGRPAATLHSRPAPAGRNVLNLRDAAPNKTTTPKTPAARWNQKLPTEQATPLAAHHSEPAAPAPKTTAKEVHFGRFEDRFKQAKNVPRSQLIAKFGQTSGPSTHQPSSAPAAPTPAAPTHHAALPELPPSVATQHQALARLAPPASTPAVTAPKPRTGRFSLKGHTGQYAAGAAAIAIMGGYIWLQNYPKMAIQTAGNKAGLAVSLPGYVPSSYRLSDTTTNPGLVTLKFKSPSQPGALTIKQHRTTWDSQSLVDQFVATKSAEYTAVEGQGLTIYLYGQNQATWVNHGVWYSIEGASRLSREQILKIAYSL